MARVKERVEGIVALNQTLLMGLPSLWREVLISCHPACKAKVY